MAFWSLENWQTVTRSCPIVSDFDETHFGDGCYRLALGREAVVSVQANATSGVRRNIEADGELQLLPGSNYCQDSSPTSSRTNACVCLSTRSV